MGKKKTKKPLGFHSSVYSLAIKCYDEQLLKGWFDTVDKIKGLDASKYQVLAIVHDKDVVTDGIWLCSIKKAHYHIILRHKSRKDRTKVKSLMNMLGVEFRQGADDNIWLNGGVESVGNFTNYSMYLTHETEEAIADGKFLYDETEIISNLTMDEVRKVRDGYIRVGATKKLSQEELIALDDLFYNKGYELEPFNKIYNELDFVTRSNAKMKIIKESYNRGIESKLDEGIKVVRTCVFIQGQKNTGKTYASLESLKRMGKNIHVVKGGGTGKFDDLRTDHNAVLIDDTTCPNLLNLTDSYMCKAYRRNANNSPWVGDVFVVVSNLTFDEWLVSCGLKITTEKWDRYNGRYEEYTEHYHAMKSRFVLGDIRQNNNGDNYLHINAKDINLRGLQDEQEQKEQVLYDFKTEFNNVMKTYKPNNFKLDKSRVADTF